MQKKFAVLFVTHIWLYTSDLSNITDVALETTQHPNQAKNVNKMQPR